MRRFLGMVLAGLGALCLVVAIGLPLFVAPAVSKLPYDLQPCKPAPAAQTAGCLKPSVAEAKDAFFLQVKKTSSGDIDINVHKATLRTTVEVLPRVQLTADQQAAGKLGDNAVVWEVDQTVIRTDTNEVVSASSTELALDRTTGAAIKRDGQWLDDSGTVDRSILYTDQVYKFPFGTEKKDYAIFDTDLRKALPARFQSVDTVNGVEVYHFVQTIPETELSVDSGTIGALVGRYAPEAKTGKIFYSNTREVWVDPVTGAYVKVREQPKQVFRSDTLSEQVLLQADFTYTPETIANSVQSVKDNGFLLKLVTLYGPILFGILAVVLLIVGLLLGRTRPAPPQAWDESLPNPRHRLRGDGSVDDTTATAAPGGSPAWPH
jgi:Porin PorA